MDREVLVYVDLKALRISSGACGRARAGTGKMRRSNTTKAGSRTRSGFRWNRH